MIERDALLPKIRLNNPRRGQKEITQSAGRLTAKDQMTSGKRQCKFISMPRTLPFGTEIQLCDANENWTEFLSYQDIVEAKP